MTEELTWTRQLKIYTKDGPGGMPQAHVVEYFEPMGMYVHVRELCSISEREGVPCAIHTPSDHHMRDWPRVFRYDRGIMERTCKHGVGHPDPDDAAYRRWAYEKYNLAEYDEGVHGCDLCCGNKNSQALARERSNLKKLEDFHVPHYQEIPDNISTYSVREAMDMLFKGDEGR